jgi:Cu2+-exporting ATPase
MQHQTHADAPSQHAAHGAHAPAAPAPSAAHAGHDRHVGHSVAMFRDRFWLSLALTVPVVLLSPEVAGWIGYTIPAIPGLPLAPALLGTIVFLYGGTVFIRGAATEARDRRPGMMSLISLAILVAFVTSWAGTLGLFQVEIWWELASLVTIMLLGHWLEMRSIEQAQGSLAALASLLPDSAERISAGEAQVIALAEVATGDLLLVRPGGRVPADGTVEDGRADVDESMLTGESRAIAKAPGDSVVAGTVVAGGSLRVRVTATGDSTALSGIMRIVAEAQASSSRSQALADRAAALLFYVAVTAGLVTLVGWTLLGDPEGALVRTATVLVIACPHALGLAIPLVVAISTSLGARNGLLVRDRMALELARTVDTVVFDKTGTLTVGAPSVGDVIAEAGLTTDQVLSLAAAVEADSEHPVAAAVRDEARRRRQAPGVATSFEALPGRGVRGVVDGVLVSVVGPRVLEESGLQPDATVSLAADTWSRAGRTVLFVVAGDRVAGAIAIEDEVRPESRAAVDELRGAGVRVAMITGDAAPVARSVAQRLGIDDVDVAAQVLPGDKSAAIRRFQEGGRVVAMVGDGVNDAPALETADVGMAIGAGTDVAIESAGVVLVRSDPRDVMAAIRLSAATYRKMVQNLVWATGYNLVAIPVAMGLLVPWGVDLPMAVGAIAMSVSTIVVAANAQLLRGARLRDAT